MGGEGEALRGTNEQALAGKIDAYDVLGEKVVANETVDARQFGELVFLELQRSEGAAA